MNFSWNIFIDLGIISAALLAATFIRVKVSFFQKYLIPNALTAGFILLPIYNFLLPELGMGSEGLGELVYHLLNLSFISMTLRRTERQKGSRKSVAGIVVGLLSGYATQALLGMLLTFLFIGTIMPNLFPGFGLYLPLGFALGPGQAYAITVGWEQFGVEGSGSVGLTFAAIGYLWACFGGVFLINKGIRRGWLTDDHIKTITSQKVKRGVVLNKEERSCGSRLSTETEAIDSLSLHLGLVLFVYLITYLFLTGLTALLSLVGPLGQDLAINLWGIAFIFAGIWAIIFKKILGSAGLAGLTDNATLNRISGSAVDLMVAAAVGAISLVVVSQYWIPILVLGIVGGVLTLALIPWISSRMFKDHRFHRALIVYGASTGTLPTGLALLRVIDPEFESPTASDYMYAAAFVFILAIPFIMMINLPAYGYTTGNPIYYWLTMLICTAYVLACFVGYILIAKKNSFKTASRTWLRD
ncbi:MAG: sodium:glutamate symporter [Spirochaetia bacterium]